MDALILGNRPCHDQHATTVAHPWRIIHLWPKESWGDLRYSCQSRLTTLKCGKGEDRGWRRKICVKWQKKVNSYAYKHNVDVSETPSLTVSRRKQDLIWHIVLCKHWKISLSRRRFHGLKWRKPTYHDHSDDGQFIYKKMIAMTTRLNSHYHRWTKISTLNSNG